MASTPYCCFISGLTKRQPMVVSKISALRWKASLALPITSGARVIDSTPPAIAKSIHRHARNMIGQPGQQRRHAGDVAVVFARLIGAAEYDFIELRPIDLRVAPHKRTNGDGRQVVSPHLGKR